MNLSVFASVPAPVFPSVEIQSRFTFLDAPGVGPDLRLDADPVVPPSFAWNSCRWIVRVGGPENTPKLDVTGDPNMAVTAPNTSGTYGQINIERAPYGLNVPGSTIYVTCICGDTSGAADAVTNTQTNP